MIFIVGGFSQGKTCYAEENFENAREHIMYLNEWAEEVFRQEKDPLKFIIEKINDDPDLIIISTEIGNGIVPVDDNVRTYRKKIGHLQCEVAKLADEVVRVTCGIGVKIK